MLNIDNIINSSTGFVHLSASLMALICGPAVLLRRKGDCVHRIIGYCYFTAMVVLNGTAFMIYDLYGKPGIFHLFAGLSLATVIAGLVPIIGKNKNTTTHFRFMYWSVVGLYAALAAEVFTRLPKIVLNADGSPNVIFYKFAGAGTLLIIFIGIFGFIRMWPRWKKYAPEKWQD